MTKAAPTLVRIECELRDEFRVPANERICPNAYKEIPNTLTAKVITTSGKGEGVFTAISTSKLYKQLGI